MRFFECFYCLALILIATIAGCNSGYVEETEDQDLMVATPAPPKLIEPKIAEVGVGIKGQSLRDETGVGKIISQPAMTLFTTKEKIAFEILIPQAMGLFEGLNGRKPTSHEEFMEKIIKEQQIALPKLPDGQVYRYHPDDFQLWVEPSTEG